MGQKASELLSAATDCTIEDAEFILSLSSSDTDLVALGALERAPGKTDNWVESAGGLPAYIEKIAESLHTKQGMSISRAIATAISQVKRWAAGGEDVKPDTRAKAAAAVAAWNALKAKNATKGSK